MSYSSGIRTRLDTVWGSPLLGPDGKPWESTPNLHSNRDRARRLERESALAYGILDRSDENVIGTGIGVVPKSSDPEFNKRMADLWADWTEGKWADVRRTYSFGQLQRFANRHVNRDGDCGFILIDRTDQGVRFPELQFVPGELIETPRTAEVIDRTKVVDGIEYNEVNAPIAYWVKGDKKPERVDARDFIFLHSTTRYNVGRGQTKFHGTYRLFDQVEGFIEAVVVAARIGASQAMIAKTNKGADAARKLGLNVQANSAIGQAVPAKIIEPGMINYIGTDEDIVPFNPSQPQTTFAPFLVTIARLLGVKFGLTVQRVLLTFEELSYSGTRATTLQEMQAAWPAQDDFNASFLARVYPWFVSMCVAMDYVEGYTPATAPDDAWRYDWVPPGRPLNDTEKEAAGFELMMKLGLAAPEMIATSMGESWDKLRTTIAKNKAEMAAMGIAWPGGLPPAAAAPPDGAAAAQESGRPDEVSPREKVDAFGIGVRAGVVTPQIEDEEELRKVLRLPQMSDAVREVWKEEGVRRPITIAGTGEGGPPVPAPTEDAQ